MEAKLLADIITVEDATYVMFEEGFDEVVAQVKHFNANVSIDFNSVNKEKKLVEILEQQSPIEVDSP